MDRTQALIDRSITFLQEIKDMTPGSEMERWLNTTYGPHSVLYADLAGLIKSGVAEGWAAHDEIGGPDYRRGRILAPTPETFHFSITAVYMNSRKGDYHGHPYGEINLVVPIDESAELKGLQGWQGAGWTAPDPGSRHFPEVRGGALISLTYLPAGRISFDVKPDAAVFAAIRKP